MKNPIIYTKLSIVMQALLDDVKNGNTRYVQGSIPVEKTERTVAVFNFNYQAFADRNERARRKRSGLGNVRAVLRYDSKSGKVDWWLLTTLPEVARHTIHETDKLKDALVSTQRIEINGFELVRQPKIGTSQFKWTWRMSESKYQEWRDYVIKTVRSRSRHQMDVMLYQLFSSPGFNGIRIQAGKLIALYKAEVKRASLKDAPQPPRRLQYLRRIKHDGITLYQLKAQFKSASLQNNLTESD